MKEAIVHPDGHVVLHDVAIPNPGPHEILVKVVATGINPKDYFYPIILNNPHNTADDIAGYVEAVGDQVLGFSKGDRVVGMHKMPGPHGGFAEFAILPDYTTFSIPQNISFEQVCEVPHIPSFSRPPHLLQGSGADEIADYRLPPYQSTTLQRL